MGKREKVYFHFSSRSACTFRNDIKKIMGHSFETGGTCKNDRLTKMGRHLEMPRSASIIINLFKKVLLFISNKDFDKYGILFQ